ncbi:LOW QUALITY PROTEIN: hypothetical protein OSB04_003647 [Centaurea solstitialis]|uniref:Polyprotein n=1 Tax=Centaurea solstitialis TaxID=347529 RepID=A0AA38WVS5_9ASTR|nr:LOW QUALITY PROTEIN: hypothetical protein OSB04_003647 [Centaurea solstitialis]
MDEEQNNSETATSHTIQGSSSKPDQQQFLTHTTQYPMSVANFAPLNGVNYKKWKEDIELMLGILDYDHILKEDPPPEPTDTATKEVMFKFQEWHKHNRIALIYIKKCMTDAVKGGIPESNLAKVYFASIADKYKIRQKLDNLMNKLIRMSFNGQGSIREYILQGIDTSCKLKEMKVEIDDSFLVHLLLNSLPDQYSHLRSLYNTQKERWTLDELITICVQEESEIKSKGKAIAINYMPKIKPRDLPTFITSAPFAKKIKTKGKPFKNKRELKCFFCTKMGHFKKDCEGFKEWLNKKGNAKHFFSLETTINDSDNSWWFDTGSPIHIVNSMQELSKTTVPRLNESRICTTDGQALKVEAIGECRLLFKNNYVLTLKDVYYIPENNVSFYANKDSMLFYLDDVCFGNAYLIDGYWHLNCVNETINKGLKRYICSINKFTGSKKRHKQNVSSFLWHKRLGHISKSRMQDLIRQKILPELDFNDFETCVDCLKGKMTNFRNFYSKRSQCILELIHTDICGPFPIETICGNRYFATFIDDFSRFCYIFLMSEKSQVLDCFIQFKTEVERQSEKVIKVVRSDRGEYFGKYSEKGQHKGPFAIYLEQVGIKAEYTTPYTPTQNGVAERKNRTLMDMVRSMFARSSLPKFLWGEALKTANYICNRTPTKAIKGTPFELWNGYKPSLNHFHVWGCKAETREYHVEKLSKVDSRSLSAFFIGYSEKSKGFKFYNPGRGQRIFETNKAVFYDEIFNEDDDMADSSQIPQNLDDWMTYHENEPSLISENENITLQPIPILSSNVVEEIDQNANNSSLEPPQDQVHEPILENVPEHVEEQLPEPIHNTEPLRRSMRERRSAISDDYHVYLTEIEFDLGEDDDPTSFKEAMGSPNKDKWLKAMEDELTSMSNNEVWDLIDKSNSIKPIGNKWVFKTKRDANGKIERYKARLVAKGYNQKEGIDYNETFSPVSTKDAFRVLMALVAHFDLELHQMDVKTAFLNGDLEEEIHMTQPEGFVINSNQVCKLNKSIYGLKQASRQWYKKFDTVMNSFGFEENKLDECIYSKTSGSSFIFLILYVDDILLATNSKNLLQTTKAFLMKSFDMKDMGEAHYVLGIEIIRNRRIGTLGLSQKGYIEKVLKRFVMESCRSGDAPMSKGDKLHKGQCPSNTLEKKEMDKIPYARLIGSLMYAQVCTRPDIAFAVNMLSRFQSNAGHAHWVAGKKVLRYLKGTINHMLLYRRIDDQELKIECYTDASYKQDHDDLKSTSGYIFMLAGGAISWKASKQSLTATSTFQAEYIAIYDATSHAIWLKNFVAGLKIMDSIEKPLTIYCDNAAAVFFTKNNKRSSGSRNIDVKYFAVRENVRDKEIEVLKISTKEQLADPFTKALPVECFKRHIKDMGISNSADF